MAPLQCFDGAARFERNRYREERSDAPIQEIIGLLRRPLDRHASLAMTTKGVSSTAEPATHVGPSVVGDEDHAFCLKIGGRKRLDAVRPGPDPLSDSDRLNSVAEQFRTHGFDAPA